MRILGVDPGMSGALAVLDSDSGQLWARDVPTLKRGLVRDVGVADLAVWIASFDIDLAVIEFVHAMPKQGVSSTFLFGGANGALRATIILSGAPVATVTPQRWKKHFGLIKTGKEASRQLALTKFPQAASLLSRKRDHQRAEAILIAAYADESGLLPDKVAA